jgi:signal transduction histidine kinase
MKLQTKYNRATISAAVFVLLLGSIGYYFILRYVLIKEVDDALKVEEQEILYHVQTYHSLPEETNYKDQLIHFYATNSPQKREFKSVSVKEDKEDEMSISRQLSFPVNVNGKIYTAVVTKSEEEAEDMLLIIGVLTVGVILLLIAIMFFANRILLKKLWSPFYSTLATMKQFNLSSPVQINSAKNDIDEFNDLNKAVSEMTTKVASDYLSLKTFTDNASHEMQTPLAVIKSKVDLLIQDQHLSEKNMEHLESIYDAVSRLRRMNQSLLLISKIENHQFPEAIHLRLDNLVAERLQHFEELVQARHLVVKTSLEKCEVLMNPLLADILLNNLLTNAIRHNIPSGNIEISSEPHSLSITNQSKQAPLNETQVFERFHKDAQSDGLGIGLAIVKQICDLYGFRISYAFREQKHAFQVIFFEN